MNNVLVTVRRNPQEPYDKLYINDMYFTEEDDVSPSSFVVDMPIVETDDISVELKDGTLFRISKQQSLNDVGHGYWAFTMFVPPLEHCEMVFAGRSYADSLWSRSHVKHIWVNGMDVSPIPE